MNSTAVNALKIKVSSEPVREFSNTSILLSMDRYIVTLPEAYSSVNLSEDINRLLL